MPEFSENAGFLSDSQMAAIELPFLAQLGEMRGDVPVETAQRLYKLGREAGITLAREAAALEVNIAPSSGSLCSGVLGERSWMARAELKVINSKPVAGLSDLLYFEENVVRKSLKITGMSVRVMNALRRNYCNDFWLNELGERLLTETSFYKADESRAQRREDFTYIDLLSLTVATEELIEVWQGAENFRILPGFNSGSIRFLARFLNYALELDPPLKTYD